MCRCIKQNFPKGSEASLSASGKLHPVASSPLLIPISGRYSSHLCCCLPPVPGSGSWEVGRRTFPTSRKRRKGRPRARVSSAAWAAPPELLTEKRSVGTAYHVGYGDQTWYIICCSSVPRRFLFLSPSQSTHSIPVASTPRALHPSSLPRESRPSSLLRSALRGADLGPQRGRRLRRSGRRCQSPPHVAAGVGAAATTPRIAAGPGYASPGDQPCCQAATQKYFFPSSATVRNQPGLSWRLYTYSHRQTHARRAPRLHHPPLY